MNESIFNESFDNTHRTLQLTPTFLYIRATFAETTISLHGFTKMLDNEIVNLFSDTTSRCLFASFPHRTPYQIYVIVYD